MRTPIGTISAVMTFVDDHGALAGSAEGRGENVPLRDVRTVEAADGELVTWSQSITKPVRLDLDFEVMVVGDRMEGHSRAGRLPRSAVSGLRVERR